MAAPPVTELPDSGKGMYDTTPFGGDKNTDSHVQPADVSDANKTLPGEQEDPRFC